MDLSFSQESGDWRERWRAVSSSLLLVVVLDWVAGGLRYLDDSLGGVMMMILINAIVMVDKPGAHWSRLELM